MSITDELREYIWQHATNNDELRAIADRIDAEHEAKVSYWQGASYKDGYDEGFASADDWLAQHEDAMAEHGWVRGPIGADGKPMAKEHMVVDNGGDVGVIVETRFNDSNWLVLVDFGEGDSCRFTWFLPKSLTHYHAPTVEDVLREMLYKAHIYDEREMELLPDLIAEYAKRLTLAEGVDE